MPRIEGLDDGQDGCGYAVSGGAIRDIARGEGNRLVVYVEAGVAPGDQTLVTVELGNTVGRARKLDAAHKLKQGL